MCSPCLRTPVHHVSDPNSSAGRWPEGPEGSCGGRREGPASRPSDVRRRANSVFVLSDKADSLQVLGYYTLCATALPPGDVPLAARKHIPRYPLVSATLIGRLAVAMHRQGRRLGALLLADALGRALASAGTVGSSMIVVDALDEAAAAFYAAHGAIGKRVSPRRQP